MGGLLDTPLPPPLQLPPQPRIQDFTWEDTVNHLAYKAALEAWERVCTMLAEKHYAALSSAAFWGKG